MTVDQNKVCRLCQSNGVAPFLDLGSMPLANSFVPLNGACLKEPVYPLRLFFCPKCYLVQQLDFQSPRSIFADYPYYSSHSHSLLEQSRIFADTAINQFSLNRSSRVIEIASNDGYLLQYFQKAGIPCLGVEASPQIALEAERKKIPTLNRYFDFEIASELISNGGPADLLIANNVLAHVDDLNSFVRGLKELLAPEGVLTVEFQYLLRLIMRDEFDQIYHEHFSYFCLLTAERIFKKHGLRVFDAEELHAQGGSLRIYLCHDQNADRQATPQIDEFLSSERQFGLDQFKTYQDFDERVKAKRKTIVSALDEIKRKGQTLVGYGAPAKASTFLNYCGVDRGTIPFTADINPYKQGRAMPGSQIPIRHPDAIREAMPDYVLIFPWNIQEEIMTQLAYIREWDGHFIVAIPSFRIL